MMRTSRIFVSLLLVLFCWQMQVQAQSVMRKFVNTQDFPIILYVASEESSGQQTKKQTIEIEGHNGAFRKVPVEVGDFVWAEAKNSNDYKTDRIFINGARGENEPIYLSPQLSFLDFYGKLGNNNQANRFIGMAYNLYGVDITKYKPRRVIDGFTNGQIFKGIGNEKRPSATRSYYLQKSSGTILPAGYDYTGADSDQDGSMVTNEYYSENSFKKAWNLSLGGSGSKNGVKGNVDFSYGEDFEKSNNQSYVYYIKEQTNRDYNITLDLNVVEFNEDFINRVESIKTTEDARRFVKDFGTHYPVSVTYGGRYSQYTSVSKSDYYEAKRKNLNLKAAIGTSSAENDREETSKPNNVIETKTIIPGKSKSASGSVGFSLNESQELREILSNSKSRYFAIGGTITSGQEWVAAGTKTAIEVELEEITNLIDAKILKSRLKAIDLTGKRELVADEVKKKIDQLKDYENRLERAYEMQVVKIRITNHTDDADKRGYGFIRARVSGNNNIIPLFEVPVKTEGFMANWEIHFQDPNEKSVATRTWHPFFQKADTTGQFSPLTVDFSAKIVDSDHCCGDEEAVLNWGQMPTKPLITNQPLTHKLVFKDTDHLPLQDWGIEATVMIRPMLKANTRSASTISASPVNTTRKNVPKYQPPTIDEATFNRLAKPGKLTMTTKESDKDLNNSKTSSPKKINGQNASKVSFSGGAFVQQAGTKNWSETDANGTARFRYVETGRDEWSVYLIDKSRNVGIALDLFKKQIKYKGPNAAAYRNLYGITGAQ